LSALAALRTGGRTGRRKALARRSGAAYSAPIERPCTPPEPTMNIRLNARLASVTLAALLTLATLAGIDTLASVDAAAPQLAQASPARA
jgi:hypothetical protein